MSDSHNSSRASGFRQFRAGIVFLEFLAPESLKNTIPAPSAVACRRKTTSNSNSNSDGISNSNTNSNNWISNSNRNSISMSNSHNSGRSIGVRQFRAGIVFLEFIAAENFNNTMQ